MLLKSCVSPSFYLSLRGFACLYQSILIYLRYPFKDIRHCFGGDSVPEFLLFCVLSDNL